MKSVLIDSIQSRVQIKMAYPIHEKLVIAVASSALFDLSESDAVFREHGEEKYREYQRKNKSNVLNKSVAFPFVRRFLRLNLAYPEKLPVEVVLLSRNDPETGLRVLNSIKHYNLDITRAAFLSGKSPYPYIPAFNVSLFLSTNPEDVKKAIEAGYPAGTVMSTEIEDDENENELIVAFDFDGVIADDECQIVYESHDLTAFNAHEVSKVDVPHNPGPLSDLFRKLSFFQKLERKRELSDKEYKRILRTAIVTARSAPAHERVVTTLREWGISPDETFFLGGMEKHLILETLKPHIFFDDQPTHLKSPVGRIPMVHIPYGITNRPLVEKNKAKSLVTTN
jgi:5'-nucleotidase